MVDANTRKTLSGIPLLQTKAGPRDKELWVQRLKEEYQALIKVCTNQLNASTMVIKTCFSSIIFTVRSKQQRLRHRLVPFGIKQRRHQMVWHMLVHAQLTQVRV